MSNRHERRREAKRAKVRARLGKTVRDAIRERELPPGYVDLIKGMCRLIVQWRRDQPTTPALKWHDRGDVLYAGDLCGPGLKFLADSPDAFRLCAWIDEQTGRQATLFQMDCALRFVGELPGSELRVGERRFVSPALETLASFAHHSGTETAVPPSPCGHCGVPLTHASGKVGTSPSPGAFTVCVKCFKVNQFDDNLQNVAFPEERFAELPPEFSAELQDMQTMMRQAILQHGGSRNLYKKERVEA